MPDLVEQPGEARSEALFSVVAGEGDGLMLGLVAGDTAGGAWDLGYSAVSEQATLVAYELIAHETLDPDRLVAAFLEFDGEGHDESVFRAETPELRSWLDRAADGDSSPGIDGSLDAAARALPLGVAFRRDPDMVVDSSILLGRLFHRDASTVAAGIVAAAAGAASCFAQSGLDLIAGVAEAVAGVGDRLASEFERAEKVASIQSDIEALSPHLGVTAGDEALAAAGGNDEDPLQMVMAGVLLAAPVAQRHHLPIEQAAKLGGSRLAAVVGGLIGARVGIRAWPWPFANDTWFAEIGRRLVRGPREVVDLPIPYAVEQHLMTGGRPGFH